MATIWDERYEGAGREQSWTVTGVVQGGSTVDPDKDTSTVAGAPDNWGSDCNEFVVAGTDLDCYDIVIGVPAQTTTYYRIDAIVQSESFADNETNLVFEILHDLGDILLRLQVGQASGVLYWFLFGNTDGSYGLEGLTPCVLGQPHTLELFWDVGGLEWSCWIDGVELASGVISGDPDTGFWQVTDFVVGSIGDAFGNACTFTLDNLVINNVIKERIGTGRNNRGMQGLGRGFTGKTMSPARPFGARLGGAMQTL